MWGAFCTLLSTLVKMCRACHYCWGDIEALQWHLYELLLSTVDKEMTCACSRISASLQKLMCIWSFRAINAATHRQQAELHFWLTPSLALSFPLCPKWTIVMCLYHWSQGLLGCYIAVHKWNLVPSFFSLFNVPKPHRKNENESFCCQTICLWKITSVLPER